MSKGKILAAWVLVLITCHSGPAAAATLNVPSQYPSIAAALSEAHRGDIIKIAPGLYQEYGLVLPGGITLDGSGALPSDTIIDGGGQGRILTARDLEYPSFIQDLTFTNGWAQDTEGYGDCGGAIYINRSMLRIANCRFVGNQAEFSGGAISCMLASPIITNCYFEANRSSRGGGALDCSYDASPLVRNSKFVNNSAAFGGALTCRGDSRPQVSDCQFDNNSTEGDRAHGGAVLSFFWGGPDFLKCTFKSNAADQGGALCFAADSPASLTSCTVVENSAAEQGGGILTQGAALEIRTSIITHQEGSGVTALGTAVPHIECTDIYGNSGGDWIGSIARQADSRGNLAEDPLFCESDPDETYRFHLQEGSPCSEEGGACVDLGAWPVGCHQVAEYFDSSSFQAKWVGGVPEIVWEASGSIGPIAFRLARSSKESPQQEQDLQYTANPEGLYTAHDRELVPRSDIHYLYRLYLLHEDGSEFLLDWVSLDNPPNVRAMTNVGAWPNPFNPQTTIHFELGVSQQVRVEVFGIDGGLVRTLADQTLTTGPHDLRWDGRDNGGRIMASGPYVIQVCGKVDHHRLKVTLLK